MTRNPKANVKIIEAGLIYLGDLVYNEAREEVRAQKTHSIQKVTLQTEVVRYDSILPYQKQKAYFIAVELWENGKS
jgi:hypothetical protein